MTDYRCVNGHDKCGEMYTGPECPYCERTNDTSAAVERLRLYIEYDGGALPTADARAILAHIAGMRSALEKARAFIESEYRDPAAEPEGEWLAAEARPVHAVICQALAAAPATPEKPSEALSAVEKALSLAVNMLAQHEPGDSRAVSDEFVAIAAVHTGDTSEPVMRVIDTALEEAMTKPTKPYLRRAMQEPPQ